MRILMATDAFPPNCGGSGWSTYELARGLRARGHDVTIVQPRPGAAADARRSYEGLTVLEVAAASPAIPFVRNYFKNERLWARLAVSLRDIARRTGAEVLHAQHVLTAPAAVEAGRGLLALPVVCTVRDYWPVCYWGTLIHDPDAAALCPGCSPSMMRRCVRPRAGAAWPLALPFVPYMRGNLARKQRALAGADAIVAVSSAIAHDLRARSQALHAARIEVIPNPVDVPGLQASAAASAAPLAGPYAVFVGKLERNKGTDFLLGAIERAGLPWPLVIVGDGRERSSIERAAAHSGREIRFTGWLAREQALGWLAHASLLVFPSHGPESLSRVLLEASALGVPIAAMHTGGTRDIVEHEITGLLSSSPDELGDHVARLVSNRTLANELATRARARVASQFSASGVAGRIEALYDDLVGRRRRDG